MSVYNEEKYVAAAIKSILNQTYPHFEFIIISIENIDCYEKCILCQSFFKAFLNEKCDEKYELG